MSARWISAGVAAAAMWAAAWSGHAEPVAFVSTQPQQAVSAENLRQVVLKNFGSEVDYRPVTESVLLTDTAASSADVVGATSGAFSVLAGAGSLAALDALASGLGDPRPAAALVEEGKLGTDQQLFVPWMHATYLMAANRKALEHLPEGATLDSLTYGQLGQWAANVEQAAGSPKLGLPAGPDGAIDRFVEGYLYPSHTGSVVRGFKGAAATAMWANVRKLWSHAAPASTGYAAMAAPLLAEEVWIAFDHVARLRDAFLQEPDQFVAFPAPVGPKGRGFMPVLAGLGISKAASDPTGAAQLIDYLMQPETQITTVQELGFYPSLEMRLPENIQPGIRAIGDAMSAQADADHALPARLPSRLGAKAGDFDQIYRDTFTQIVVDGADIATVLGSQAAKLTVLLTETGSRCSPPDTPSEGPCPVE